MRFIYKAYDGQKQVKGNLDAENIDQVTTYLKSHNLVIIEIKKNSQSPTSFINSFFSKVGFSDIVDLTRQFAIMLSSGLTIADSLSILKKQAKKPGFVKLLTQIEEDVKGGNSLSSSLKKREDLFSHLYIALVRAGEASGKLDSILMKLAEDLERQRQFRNKIKGALIYPAIIIVAMLTVMFIMITFVIPQLLTIYQDFDIELPVATRFLIAMSNFFSAYWVLILIGLATFIFLFHRYYRSKKGRQSIDAIFLRLPLVSQVIKVSVLVDLTRTLSTLISAGVAILEALDIAKETTSNIVYQRAFENIHQKIEKGDTLGRALEQEGIFPPILVQMASVGEQTGHLDDTLMHLSNYFENESETATKALTVLIEPTVLVFLGLSVGFVVIAVITPIFSLSNAF